MEDEDGGRLARRRRERRDRDGNGAGRGRAKKRDTEESELFSLSIGRVFWIMDFGCFVQLAEMQNCKKGVGLHVASDAPDGRSQS